MRIADVLTGERVLLDAERRVASKADALAALAELLAPGVASNPDRVLALLKERESLHSTGIGEGVAVPHAWMEEAPHQAAALLIRPGGIPFDAIDGRDCAIIFGLVGPRRAPGDHLKTLARISRLLRDEQTRAAMVLASDAAAAFRLVAEKDGGNQ